MSRQEQVEVLVDRLQAKIDALEQNIKNKVDYSELIITIHKIIKDEELVTKSDIEKVQEKMEASTQESQVKLLKWIIAMGLSTIATISAVISIFY